LSTITPLDLRTLFESAGPRDDARPELIIHQVEDVTEFVRGRKSSATRTEPDGMEGEILRRSQQLQETNRALREANERLVAASELQFRMLFDLIPQLGWTARPDGLINFYNLRWYDYTGMTAETQTGWGWESVLDPALSPSIIERWKHSLSTGTSFEMEFPLRRADGAFRWFITRIVPIRDQNSAIVCWIGIATDIHVRKQANDESDESLRLLSASIKDYAAYLLDAGGNVQSWNPGAERIKQYRADEVIGKHLSLFYPEESVAAGEPARALAAAAEHGHFEDQGWRVRKDGSCFWANVVIHAERGEGGKLVGFSKVTRDLTDRKNAEEGRAKLILAQEAIRLRDEFLSIASHELKTPLTSLQLIAGSLLRAATMMRAVDPDTIRTRVATLDTQLRRLTALINDLLDVGRTSAGRLRIEVQDVDLDRVVRDIAERLQPDLAAAKCRLTIQSQGPLIGRWDHLRVDRVATNLLTNAVKYGRGSRIDVNVDSDGTTAVFAVRDHGIGIAAVDHERIFDRFARAVSADNYGGFGLGLWIARQFVEAMGGAIAVESAPGQGSCFTVRLPLAGSAASESVVAG
jgi:PAS domain S-box-containing protein